MAAPDHEHAGRCEPVPAAGHSITDARRLWVAVAAVELLYVVAIAVAVPIGRGAVGVAIALGLVLATLVSARLRSSMLNEPRVRALGKVKDEIQIPGTAESIPAHACPSRPSDFPQAIRRGTDDGSVPRREDSTALNTTRRRAAGEIAPPKGQT